MVHKDIYSDGRDSVETKGLSNFANSCTTSSGMSSSLAVGRQFGEYGHEELETIDAPTMPFLCLTTAPMYAPVTPLPSTQSTTNDAVIKSLNSSTKALPRML